MYAALMQKRDNQTVLETLMQAGEVVAYLTSLLTAPYVRQVQLAAVKLLTTICSTESGKMAAARHITLHIHCYCVYNTG